MGGAESTKYKLNIFDDFFNNSFPSRYLVIKIRIRRVVFHSHARLGVKPNPTTLDLPYSV